MLKKFLDAMEEGKEYDFIANFYGEMSKFDLRTILLEYMYAIHCQGQEEEEAMKDVVKDSLEEKEIFG